jgi:ferritin-like metal-binding protein YciE
MAKLESLHGLYVHELKDMYSAENQILKALPKMIRAASSIELRGAFEEHLEQTEDHVRRLEQIGESLGKSLRGQKCKGMEGLLKEGQELLKEDTAAAVLDAGLIVTAQKVEHYEIAGYGTLRAYAQLLGEREAVAVLQQTLDEETETDKRLTLLAENSVNIMATAGYRGDAVPQ